MDFSCLNSSYGDYTVVENSFLVSLLSPHVHFVFELDRLSHRLRMRIVGSIMSNFSMILQFSQRMRSSII